MFKERASFRTGGMRIERWVEAKERRAVGADDLAVVTQVEKDMRMIEWRERPDAHEFARADLDHARAGLVVEMGNDMVCHDQLSGASSGKRGAAAAFATHLNGPSSEILVLTNWKATELSQIRNPPIWGTLWMNVATKG
jgi:hypothetical protein